jgi:hypothetical protein
MRQGIACIGQWQTVYDRVCYGQGDAPVPAYPLDAVAEAIGGLLQEAPIPNLPSPWDSFLENSRDARVFFLNEVYPRYAELWGMLAPTVSGWQSLYPSVSSAIISLAASFIAGVTICAPRPDNSGPVLRSSRLGAPPP